MLYADDTSLFLSSDNVTDLFFTANAILDKLREWSEANCLTINTKTSKSILFTPKHKRISVTEEICLGNSKIDIVEQHKVLGVVLSHHMSWDAHIQMLTKQLSSAVGVLYRCRDFFPLSIKLQIHHCIFRSRLNYCTLVWGTTIKNNITTLFLLEKKVVRCINNVHYLHPIRALFAQHKLIRIDNLYDYRLLFQFHFSDALNQQFLKRLSCLTIRTQNYSTRKPDMLLVPFLRTNYSFQALARNIPSILNRNSVEFSGLRFTPHALCDAYINR